MTVLFICHKTITVDDIPHRERERERERERACTVGNWQIEILDRDQDTCLIALQLTIPPTTKKENTLMLL